MLLQKPNAFNPGLPGLSFAIDLASRITYKDWQRMHWKYGDWIVIVNKTDKPLMAIVQGIEPFKLSMISGIKGAAAGGADKGEISMEVALQNALLERRIQRRTVVVYDANNYYANRAAVLVGPEGAHVTAHPMREATDARGNVLGYLEVVGRSGL